MNAGVCLYRIGMYAQGVGCAISMLVWKSIFPNKINKYKEFRIGNMINKTNAFKIEICLYAIFLYIFNSYFI